MSLFFVHTLLYQECLLFPTCLVASCLSSMTTFSAASFRLLSLGFHGLCLFFGCVTLMIQILQVSSAWWMLRARPMSQWWRNEQVIVKIRYMGRREWCCSRTAGWLAGVTFGCRKEIWVKGLKEIRGSFPYVTQVWRQVVKRWCGGAMMSAGVLPSSSTCLSQARAESRGPLQLNSEDRNIW